MLLAAACLAPAGAAMAGTTTVVGGALSYAREVGVANAVYTIPAQTITRDLNVIRNANQDFFLTVTIGNGPQFTSGTLPTPTSLALTTAAGGAATITKMAGTGLASNTSVTYFVDVTTGFTGLATFTLTTTGWTIGDPTNKLGGGGTVTITLATKDAATGLPVDTGTDTVNWLTGVFGVTDATLVSTTAIVDVATGRKNFVANTPDTGTQDNGATLRVNYAAGVLGTAGTAYALSGTTDAVVLVIAGNLSGLFNWTFNPESGGGASPVVDIITAAEVTDGASVLTLTGQTNLDAVTGGARGIRITVDGITPLTSRTLKMNVAIGTAGGTRTLLAAVDLSTWTLNGTVLLANWTNGNNQVLSSRFYLWNPSAVTAAITARVFSLPTGSAPSINLGEVPCGSIGATSGRVLKIAEDILTPLGIPLPYVSDGGNLVIEVTIEALGCSGWSQTFSSGLAYGTTPLVSIGAAPGPN
jgi:hypothetical protein